MLDAFQGWYGDSQGSVNSSEGHSILACDRFLNVPLVGKVQKHMDVITQGASQKRGKGYNIVA